MVEPLSRAAEGLGRAGTSDCVRDSLYLPAECAGEARRGYRRCDAPMWFAIVFVLVSVQPEMTLAKVLRFNRLAIGSSLLLAWLGAFMGARLKERPSARRGTA